MAAYWRTDLPVLLIHDVDPAWETHEIDEAFAWAQRLEAAMLGEGHSVDVVPIFVDDLATRLTGYDPDRFIVFNGCEALPGQPHSEAEVARTLEQMRFAYTGSPPETIELAWDKPTVKNLLAARGVPTPAWRVFESADPDGWDRFPAIVKPAREHCSYGVTRDSVVTNPHDLCERIGYVLATYRQPALVEEFIDGREFHVTLWGNGLLQMLPPAEMDFAAFADVHDRLCTFDSKHVPGSSHYDLIELKLPADLDGDQLRVLEQTACNAYRAVGCRDYARVDVRLTNGTFFVLDINPNSDLGADTSTALAAELVGYSYGALASRLVNLALLRHPRLLGAL
ncbi:MAG: D-alanine--D-alanine ligase family protein [Acidobacteriota bacterium]